MIERSLVHTLLKTKRFTGWLLLGLVPLFVVTGYALSGKYGADTLISPALALTIHKIFDWPLILVFTGHVVTAIYFALRRWGWISKGKARSGAS